MHKLELKYIEYDENSTPREQRLLEHSVAYGLVEEMLEKYFGIISPIILKTENGKPYIENSGIHFSISHTRGLVACVIADTPVGVDCELIKEKSAINIQKFAKRFFVENEFLLLEKGGFSYIDFYKVWTAKEATIKKRGSNMSDLKIIDITKENILTSTENGYIISINI